jgi:choline dehydrogenase-like flavoprotein
MDFDAIVIGSGFGGAVSACRLAEAGYRVLVLERGRRWNAKTYPRRDDDPWWWATAARALNSCSTCACSSTWRWRRRGWAAVR